MAPLFRRVTGQGKALGSERLNDQEVARLVKRAALASGVRGDLSEGRVGVRLPSRRRAMSKGISATPRPNDASLPAHADLPIGYFV